MVFQHKSKLTTRERTKNIAYDENIITKTNTGDNEDDRECKNNTMEKCMELVKKEKRHIKIISVNVQGLMEANHYEELCNINSKIAADVIAIQESWLRPSIPNKMININDYNIHRNDRKSTGQKSNKGGGVCCYIKRNIKSKVITQSNKYDGIECLFVEMFTKFSKILLCVIYRLTNCEQKKH